MKKTISLLTFLVCVFFCNAQDSIAFNMHYLPMHKYEQTVTQQLKTTVKFSVNDSVAAILKEKGITNPMVVNKIFEGKSVTTTESYDPLNKKMPLRLMYEEVKDGYGNILIPAGAGFIGTVQENKMPDFDSVIVPDETDVTTKTALNQIKNIFQQIHLPDTKMKVGDSYVYSTPLNLPLPSINIKANISITYKLISVTDSLANFDLLMKVNFDFDMDKATVKDGSGDGTGKLVYDRINEFPIEENLSYAMKLVAGDNDKTIEVNIDSHSSHKYIITKF